MKNLLPVFIFSFLTACAPQPGSKAYRDSVNGAAMDTTMNAASPTPSKKGTTKKDSVIVINDDNDDPGNKKGYALMESETIGELKYAQTEQKAISIMGRPDKTEKAEYWD